MPAKPLTEEQLADARRLAAAFEQAKERDRSLTQERLAFACGWKTQAAVSQYMGGKIPLNLEALLKFSKVLKVSPASISSKITAQLNGANWAVRDTQGSTGPLNGESLSHPFQDVPMAGIVEYGDCGYLIDSKYPTWPKEGWIAYPARDPDSYALRVRGDSMRPRIKNGEFIVLEPNHKPQPGDDVIVIFTDKRKMVKELLYAREGEVTLGSINNEDGNITVPSADIKQMHYVSAIVPRGAFYKSRK